MLQPTRQSVEVATRAQSVEYIDHVALVDRVLSFLQELVRVVDYSTPPARPDMLMTGATSSSCRHTP